jgi:septum formation protein
MDNILQQAAYHVEKNGENPIFHYDRIIRMVSPVWILASNSPRRKEMMTWTGIESFLVIPADIDETIHSGENVASAVTRLSKTKAELVSTNTTNKAIVIAADTVVTLGGKILGKPVDSSDAVKILLSLRGRVHQVFTAISIRISGTNISVDDLCITNVSMREYSLDEVSRYIQSGDPMDKAGAYAIQNQDFHPVRDFAGCKASVMGLPLCHLTRNLAKLIPFNTEETAHQCQVQLRYDCPISNSILQGANIG